MCGAFWRKLVDSGEGAAIFAGFVPLGIEDRMHRDERVYMGMHEQFRPIDFGEMIPEYRCEISAGVPFPTWTEVKQ